MRFQKIKILWGPVKFTYDCPDQEIEFQEIEIDIFHEIKSFSKLIRRSKWP